MTSSAEDRISLLPDALISHILSFLPTKLAVATSVLSKRWTSPWKSLLTLDFDDKIFKDFDGFRQFAHSLVGMRDPTLPIRGIRCDISKNLDPRDLNRFLQAVAQRGLEIFYLEVDDCCDIKGTVPGLLRVLSCKTLVVLKLIYLEIHEVPNLVDLPLLKTLHLEWVGFRTPFSHFMNLVRGCSLIEDLHINYVLLNNWCIDPKREFQGFPKLVRAYVRYFEESFPFVWLHNAKFISAQLIADSCYLMDEQANIDEDWKDPETVPECLSCCKHFIRCIQ